VAEKRRAELLEVSLPEQVRRAAEFPLQHCLASQGLLGDGAGVVILARGATPEHFKAALFMLDSMCLGIKDVAFRSMTGRQLEDFSEMMAETAPL